MVYFRAMPAAKPARETPEKQLKSFIDKFTPEHQRLIRAVRKVMQERYPTANELVYDNYNFFVIGYCPTERPLDSIFSIAAAANGVGLAFIQGANVPDPHHLLQGSGKKNRFLRVDSAAIFDRREIRELMAAAVEHAKLPFPRTGGGKLIIRSISTKQRPRRKPSK